MNLSQFVDLLQKSDAIISVDVNVDPILEICEITDRMCKQDGGGKALMFSNNGTQFPVLTNMMGSIDRLHAALRVNKLSEIEQRIDKIFVDVTTPKRSLMEKLALLPTLKQVAAIMPKHSRKRGSCQEFEIDADLNLLPILKCAPHDGGRFITLPMVHTIDPDNGSQNVGMYRMQLLDNEVNTSLQELPKTSSANSKCQTTGMHWHKHKTGANHYQKYKERGERMPVVVCLGGDPLYTYCATAPLPEGIDEYILAGFIRQKAVKLVKCLTCNIEVPEDVDFVIEGYVDPAEELFMEGDFGDHTGFYSLKDLYPKFHVTKITHRKNAIYPATIVGVPPMEDFYFALASERIFLKPIQMVIAPEVVDVWMPMEGVAHNIVVVTINKRYDGQAFKVVSALWGAGQMSFNKFCVVVDNSMPHLTALEKVIYALREVDFQNNTTIVKGVLDVLDHAANKSGFGGKLCLDLTSVDCESAENNNFVDWKTLIDVVHNKSEVGDAKVTLIVDENVALDAAISTILWLVAANCDPSRDIEIVENRIVIDGRAKVDLLSRHPNVVCNSVETIELVDSRWSEYGVGDFIDSPSRKLVHLQFSDSAEM